MQFILKHWFGIQNPSPCGLEPQNAFLSLYIVLVKYKKWHYLLSSQYSHAIFHFDQISNPSAQNGQLRVGILLYLLVERRATTNKQTYGIAVAQKRDVCTYTRKSTRSHIRHEFCASLCNSKKLISLYCIICRQTSQPCEKGEREKARERAHRRR